MFVPVERSRRPWTMLRIATGSSAWVCEAWPVSWRADALETVANVQSPGRRAASRASSRQRAYCDVRREPTPRIATKVSFWPRASH